MLSSSAMSMLTRICWLPGLAFLVWTEAMSRTIGFAQIVLFVLGGPRVQLSGQPLWVEAAFDLALLGLVRGVYTALGRAPAPARALATSACFVLVINNWQVLGATAWHWAPGSPAADRFGAALYYVLMAVALHRRSRGWALAALLCANRMTLDRLAICAGAALFL